MMLNQASTGPLSSVDPRPYILPTKQLNEAWAKSNVVKCNDYNEFHLRFFFTIQIMCGLVINLQKRYANCKRLLDIY